MFPVKKSMLFLLMTGSILLGTTAFQSNEPGVGNGVVDGNYIGGLFNYDPSSYPIFKSKIGPPTTTVSSADELKNALKKAVAGNIIYVKDDAQIDLSDNTPLTVPTGVTLCSGRGKDRSQGALIFSNTLKTDPMFIAASNVKIVGLRIKGPDGTDINKPELEKARTMHLRNEPNKPIDTVNFKVYGIPNSYGVSVVGRNVNVQDCEIFNWSYAGVFVHKKATAIIDHNYIHHCQRWGLGYGVCLQMGFATIMANLFDYDRHAIAGTGEAGTGYIADYNVSLPHSTLQGHIFDMHGGTDRKDGTTTAGDSIKIFNNLFFVKVNPAIRIRGIPLYNSSIYNNSFVIIKSLNYNPSDFHQSSARQIQMKPTAQVEQWVKHTLDIHNNNFYDGD